jgi:hypothetical protein
VRALEKLRSGALGRFASAVNKPVARKIAWSVAGILAVYTIVGFLVLPPVAREMAVIELVKALHREVSIQGMRFNPYTLALRISGFVIKERGSSEVFAAFDELLLDFQLVSLVRRAPVLREIRLQAPQVKITRNSDGSYNFSDLIEQPTPGSKPPATAGPPRFSLNNIQVLDGRIDFDDRPAGVRHEVRDINVSLPFLSNLPYAVDTYLQPSFRATVNGAPFALAGKTKPFEDSLESTVEIDVDHLDLPRFLAYAPTKLGFRIPSGLLDTKLTASFRREWNKESSLTLSGRVTLEKLVVTELDERPLVTLPMMAARVDSADIFREKFHLGHVLLQAPEIHVRRDRAGKINLLALTAEGAAKKEGMPKKEGPTSEKKGTLNLDLDELKVAGALIRVTDEMPRKPFRTDIEGLNVRLEKFTLPQSHPASLAVDFKTSAGESFRHEGALTLEPLSSEGKVELRRLRIAAYAPYYDPFVLFEVRDGLLDLAAQYTVSKTAPRLEATVSGLGASLGSLELRKRGERADFVKIAATEVKNAELDLGKRRVVVDEFLTRGGAIAVKREKAGSIDLTRLVAAPGLKPGETPPTEGAPAWIFTVKKATVDRYGVVFADETPAEPVTVRAEPIQAVVEGLSNQKESKAQTSLRLTVNRKGSVSLGGTLGLNPLSADLRVDVQKLDLVPLQAYITDRVKILVGSGEIMVKGRLGLKAAGEGPPQVSFTGQTNLGDFASVDRATSEDFLKWKSLFVDGIRANVNPLRLEANEVSLSDFYSRLIVYPNGTLNLREILGPSTEGGEEGGTPPAKATAPPASPAGEPPLIKIGTLVLQGGNVDFTDLFIKPNYSANLTDLGGKVSGLSSEPGTAAELEVLGRLNKSAPLEVKGKVNPLTANPFLDLKGSVKGIELEPFTPYSEKYAGYAIDKGKLSFNVDYKIENRKLKANNEIILDQLTFGEKIDSPTATRLPVLLAVALLKDRNGVIDVNLPISGSLDDPEFSVGGVILRVLTNLIAKAATSPFALLGAVFGGGEELSFVDFEPGLTTLDAGGVDKLAKLGKALNERPGLRVEVSGRADPAADREGLKRHLLERAVKAQKLKELVKKGESVPSVNDVTVDPAEYERYLTRAYREAKFPKPRNLIGMVKDLPVPEMEKLIVANTQITDADLLQLAADRAQAAAGFLINTEKVSADRVFLVSPKVEAPDKAEKGGGRRVEFALK